MFSSAEHAVLLLTPVMEVDKFAYKEVCNLGAGLARAFIGLIWVRAELYSYFNRHEVKSLHMSLPFSKTSS